jgi:hypothetical protein
MMDSHKNRPENPADIVRNVSESAKECGRLDKAGHALVVRIHVPPILSTIRLDTRINADTRASQHRGMTRSEKRGYALDRF